MDLIQNNRLLRPQTKLTLFRYCTQERVTYFSRTLKAQEFLKASETMEEWTQEFLWHMTQWDPDPVDDTDRDMVHQVTKMARSTAQLSISRGGIAIRNATILRQYAPLAAMADALNSKLHDTIFHTLRRLRNPNYQCSSEEWKEAARRHGNDTGPPNLRQFYTYHHLRETIDELHDTWSPRIKDTGPDDIYPFPENTSEFLQQVQTSKYQTHPTAGYLGSPLHVQRRMAQWIQDRLQEQTIAEAVTQADQKRIVSQGRPGGMAMFNMIPGHEDAYWTPTSYARF